MTLLFERSVAEYFVERMIGEEAPDLETIQDSVGEIANWIAGGVKGRLEQTEPSLTLSLPSVIAGKGLLVGKNSAATTIAFSFVIDQEHAVHGTMHLKQLGLARA